MIFNSAAFLVFLPVVYLLFRIFPADKRWVLLLMASWFFYCFVTPVYGLLLLATTAIDYWVAVRIENSNEIKKKKNWLVFSIVLNLLLLVAFKYSVFFYNCGVYFINTGSGNNYSFVKEWIVPAGLSFYTFQSMSYTIDVYRGEIKAQKHFGLYALFVSFFPHLVAGPVQRHSVLAPQLAKLDFPKPDAVLSHFRLIIWGFFKKMVIADNIAGITDKIYPELSHYSGSVILFAGFLFTIQLYADFSGYTDIATGVAKLFGIEFTLNWKRPLLSRGVYDYWKRHHISITSWFRDYVYVPLGGNKSGTMRWIFNIVFVFLLSGFWHGARLTFIIWGGLHALAYLTDYFFSRHMKLKFPGIFSWVLTLLFLSFSYIAFRSTDVSLLIEGYKNIFSNFGSMSFINEIHQVTDWFPLCLIFSSVVILFVKEIVEEFPGLLSQTALTKLRPALYWIIFFSIFLVGDFKNREFIYYHF